MSEVSEPLAACVRLQSDIVLEFDSARTPKVKIVVNVQRAMTVQDARALHAQLGSAIEDAEFREAHQVEL